MDWTVAPEVQASIRPIKGGPSLRQTLAEDFPHDCFHLPISGGWGYNQSESVVFVKDMFLNPNKPDFVQLEYHIVQKIIYEELIIFQPSYSKFSGIQVTLKSRNVAHKYDRKYDNLEFSVTCWTECHWTKLKEDWENNDFGQRAGFDLESHLRHRMNSQIAYDRQFWFDITDVF